MRIELTIEVLQTSALPLGYRANTSLNDTLKRKALAGAGLQELEHYQIRLPLLKLYREGWAKTKIVPMEP